MKRRNRIRPLQPVIAGVLLAVFFVLWQDLRAPAVQSETGSTFLLSVSPLSSVGVGADTLAGERVFRLDGKYTLTLVSVEATPAKEEVLTEDGNLRLVPSLLRQDIVLTLRAFGTPTDAGFLLAGRRYLAPNQELILEGEKVTLPVRVLSLAGSGTVS